MKLILHFVTLSALVVQLLSGVKAGKFTETNCAFACMLVYTNGVNADGVIDVQKFVNSLYEIKGSNGDPRFDIPTLLAFNSVLFSCRNHKHASGDKCDTAGLLRDCMKKESSKRGYDPAHMDNILTTPYYDMKSLSPIGCPGT